MVEARKLGFGGAAGRDDKLDGFVTRVGRGSATEDDRSALAAFLASDHAIVHHESARCATLGTVGTERAGLDNLKRPFVLAADGVSEGSR